MSKHLLFKSILTSINEKRTFIEITENYLDNDIITNIKEARFVEIDNSWHKININGVLNLREITQKIRNEPFTKRVIEKIDEVFSGIEDEEKYFKKYHYERYLSPIKIKDQEIPNYIVPIRPQWAEELFNDKSKEKLALFEPDYELLLNRENVYYRSSSPRILNGPARILWYVSENKLTNEKGSIIATSYIDEVFIDNPKKLFKQFQKLGIYEWKHIAQTAGNKDKIMAFVFSDTELFESPISLKNIYNLFDVLENKKFMLVAPRKIKSETYLAFYKLGMNL